MACFRVEPLASLLGRDVDAGSRLSAIGSGSRTIAPSPIALCRSDPYRHLVPILDRIASRSGRASRMFAMTGTLPLADTDGYWIFDCGRPGDAHREPCLFCWRVRWRPRRGGLQPAITVTVRICRCRRWRGRGALTLRSVLAQQCLPCHSKVLRM